VFDVDPETPIGSWKEAWESVKRNTGVVVRFHDLRHTCVTRMLEGGVPLSVVASILGWSPATTARMAKRYGHIGQVAQRQAVAVLAGCVRTSRGSRDDDWPYHRDPYRVQQALADSADPAVASLRHTAVQGAEINLR